MGPAGDLDDRTGLPARLIEPVVAAVGVGLHEPLPSGQMRLGMRRCAIGREEVDRRRRIRAGEWQVAQRLVEIDGRITNMICGSGVPVLEVASGTAVVRLALDKPKAVLVQGGSRTASFECGRQNLPVSIGYEAAVDKARKTVGKVRSVSYVSR